MVDSITAFFQLPSPGRVGASQAKLQPSILDLGADRLTFNPRREFAAKLHAPFRTGFFSDISSFLAVAKNQLAQGTSTKAYNTRDFEQVTQKYANVQELLYHRETAAETRLKELLQGLSAPPKPSQTSVVEAANAAPAITRNTGLRVAEGGTGVISDLRLHARDADTPDRNLVYTVDSDPRNGRLELSSNPGTAVTSFTQDDITSGRLRYVNNGAEFTSDSFSFTVSDGTSSASGSFSISVTPVNDAPEVTRNEGLTVQEGEAATITTAQLSAVDPDGRASQTVYEVTSGPASGRLELATDPGTEITSFTQSDLLAGRVRYINDGSEAASDSFTFRVTDGAASSASQTFSIGVTPVDDQPALDVNAGVNLDEGGTVAITSAELGVTDPDTAPENIVYTVTSAPAHGRLELATDPGTAVTSFTQADIDAGLLQYVHDGSETTDDSFSFTVSDGTTELAKATFSITDNPVDDPPELQNNGANVTEGASVTLTTANLNATDVDTASANLTFTVTTAPTGGRLENADNPGVSITSFTQEDLEAGRVRFVHDGSEGAAAGFGFSLSDGTTTLAGNSFDISVNPVDDPPVLAANTGTTVARGGSTIITSTQLNTTDVDTTSDNIVYTVTGGLSRGRLELTTNPGTPITSFTQADIDADRLRYVHTSPAYRDDSFNFVVSDGTTILPSDTFNITVN